MYENRQYSNLEEAFQKGVREAKAINKQKKNCPPCNCAGDDLQEGIGDILKMLPPDLLKKLMSMLPQLLGGMGGGGMPGGGMMEQRQLQEGIEQIFNMLPPGFLQNMMKMLALKASAKKRGIGQ